MKDALRTYAKYILATALALEARAVVSRYKPRVVAVTGSVGKTSTKDAIFAVLSARGHVRKSQKSFNSEIGLPLTILGRPNPWRNPLRWAQNLIDGLFLAVFKSRYPEWLVLEVGADRPGDIQRVATWLPVDVAVITRLPEVPVHVEFFASPAEVVEEKAALIGALKNLPSGREGFVVLYGDDARVNEFKARAGGARVVTFGFSSHCDVRAMHASLLKDTHAQWPLGMKATLTTGGKSAALEVRGALGAHALLPALAAAAVGVTQGMALADIAEALKSYEPPPGRMHLVAGKHNALIIDDTYNSSPAAVEAGLETLGLIGARRRIAVLGDMLELGRHSVEEHRKAGALAARHSDILITAGFRARDIATGAAGAGMSQRNIFECDNAHGAAQKLAALLSEGDCVFVKGSQGMRLERVVEAAMAEPARAKELLVRQEKEWKRR
jgi:UDP-N-acetylmuramyl pentapeptide synthase